MRHVANPIYDSVFKYLLEDDRITKVLLSSLLQKEVVDVQARRNEYFNETKEGVAILRIDFGAHVRENDGTIRLVLIELQKAWVESEIQRFRQYLGSQYADESNMLPTANGKEEVYGIPIVAVYLLGHKVKDLNAPIVYVRRNYLDYDYNPIVEGVPNPFVESITHDSIIVQLPLIQGKRNNSLEQFLDFFDQSRQEKNDRHLLQIEDDYENALPIKQLILDRLTMAASDPYVRQSMRVEDEVMSALTRRDNMIAAAEDKIEEQQNIIAEKDKQLSQQSEQLSALQEELKQLKELLKNT